MVHLPAVNTPQFDWCETTMDRHPQPVPPIYQPEIPARFILDAALDGQRSRIVGSWNKMLVLVDSFFPSVGNQYAALGAWESQMTNQLVAKDRPSNLRQPVDAKTDHGAHGIFDNKADGVFAPSFLRSLPKTGVTFAKACGRAYREAKTVRASKAARSLGNE
jgi:hypothetical protein